MTKENLEKKKDRESAIIEFIINQYHADFKDLDIETYRSHIKTAIKEAANHAEWKPFWDELLASEINLDSKKISKELKEDIDQFIKHNAINIKEQADKLIKKDLRELAEKIAIDEIYTEYEKEQNNPHKKLYKENPENIIEIKEAAKKTVFNTKEWNALLEDVYSLKDSKQNNDLASDIRQKLKKIKLNDNKILQECSYLIRKNSTERDIRDLIIKQNHFIVNNHSSNQAEQKEEIDLQDKAYKFHVDKVVHDLLLKHKDWPQLEIAIYPLKNQNQSLSQLSDTTEEVEKEIKLFMQPIYEQALELERQSAGQSEKTKELEKILRLYITSLIELSPKELGTLDKVKKLVERINLHIKPLAKHPIKIERKSDKLMEIERKVDSLAYALIREVPKFVEAINKINKINEIKNQVDTFIQPIIEQAPKLVEESINEEINQLILAKCQLILKENGIDTKGYEAQLKAIMQEQKLFKPNEWKEVLKTIYNLKENDQSLAEVINSKNIKIEEPLKKFIDPIVTEVKNSRKDNFIISQLKTSYSEVLSNRIKENQNKKEMLNKGQKSDTEKQLITLLDAQDDYLRLLKELPQVLEDVSLKDSLFGPNYEPNRTRKLTLELLNVASSAIGVDQKNIDGLLTKGIKNAILISGIGNQIFSHRGLNALEQVAIDYLKKIVNASAAVEKNKNDFLNQGLVNKNVEEAKQIADSTERKTALQHNEVQLSPEQEAKNLNTRQARESLLQNIGIKSTALSDIVYDAILLPTIKIREAAGKLGSGLAAGVKTISEVATSKPNVFNLAEGAFNLTENVFNLTEDVFNFAETGFIPSSIADKILPAKDAFNQIKSFKDRIPSVIPKGEDTFTSLLNSIHHGTITPAQGPKLLSYLAFYELSQDSKLEGDPSQLFLVFQNEIIRSNPSLKLESANFNYHDYKIFEDTIPDKTKKILESIRSSAQLEKPDEIKSKNKANFQDNKLSIPEKNLNLSLAGLLEDFENTENKKDKVFSLLCLKRRLDTITDVLKRPELSAIETALLSGTVVSLHLEKIPEALAELTAAIKISNKFTTEKYNSATNLSAQFSDGFLKPWVKTLIERYYQERLVIVLEKMVDVSLDYPKPKENTKEYELYQNLTRNTDKIRAIYSKVYENVKLTPHEIESLKQYWQAYDELTNDKSYKKLASDDAILEASKSWEGNAEKKKPNVPSRETLKATITKDIAPAIEPILDILLSYLREEKEACERLQTLITKTGSKDATHDSDLETLCKLKIKYIESMQDMISPIRNRDEDKHKLYANLARIVSAEIPSDIAESSVTNSLNALLGYAWHLMPPTKVNQKAEAIKPNMITQALAYTFKNSLGNVLESQQEYMTALKNAPSSHLIKDLRDPLSLTSLKTKATEMTVASMLSPFMGTLEKAGKAVFQTVAGGFYFGALSGVYDWKPFKKIGASLLEKFTGISTELITNTVGMALSKTASKLAGDSTPLVAQKLAYDYLSLKKKGPDGEHNATLDKDNTSLIEACATYYLEYRIIMRNLDNKEEQQAVIEYLFADLLKNSSENNVKSMVTDIVNSFSEFDSIFNSKDSSNIPKDNIEQLKKLIFSIMSNVEIPDKESLVFAKKLTEIIIKNSNDFGTNNSLNLQQEIATNYGKTLTNPKNKQFLIDANSKIENAKKEQRSAYDYTALQAEDLNKDDTAQIIKDFAAYYLEYRIILSRPTNNVGSKNVITELFSTYLDAYPESTKTEKIKKIEKEFSRIDNALNNIPLFEDNIQKIKENSDKIFKEIISKVSSNNLKTEDNEKIKSINESLKKNFDDRFEPLSELLKQKYLYDFINTNKTKLKTIEDNTLSEMLESFADYYIKYRVILSSPENKLNNQEIIKKIFSDYLENSRESHKESIINNFSKEFLKIDHDLLKHIKDVPKLKLKDVVLTENPKNTADALTDALLANQELSNKNIKDSLAKKLTEKITSLIGENKTNEELAKSMEKMSNETKKHQKSLEVDSSKEMKSKKAKELQGIIDVSKQIPQIQVSAVKMSMDALTALINKKPDSFEKEINHLEALFKGDSDERRLGLREAERYLRNTPLLIQAYDLYNNVCEAVGLFSTWSLIVFPLVTFTAPFMTVTAMSILGSIVVTRLLSKLASTIIANRDEFNEAAKNPVVVKRILIMSALILKSLTTTLIRMLVTDKIVKLVNSLLSPIKRIRNFIRHWPEQEKLLIEQETLVNFTQALENLKRPIEELKAEIPKGKGLTEKSKSLFSAVSKLKEDIKKAQLTFDSSKSKDARFTSVEGYAERLKEMDKFFNNLDERADNLLLSLNTNIPNLQTDTDKDMNLDENSEKNLITENLQPIEERPQENIPQVQTEENPQEDIPQVQLVQVDKPNEPELELEERMRELQKEFDIQKQQEVPLNEFLKKDYFNDGSAGSESDTAASTADNSEEYPDEKQNLVSSNSSTQEEEPYQEEQSFDQTFTNEHELNIDNEFETALDDEEFFEARSEFPGSINLDELESRLDKDIHTLEEKTELLAERSSTIEKEQQTNAENLKDQAPEKEAAISNVSSPLKAPSGGFGFFRKSPPRDDNTLKEQKNLNLNKNPKQS